MKHAPFGRSSSRVRHLIVTTALVAAGTAVAAPSQRTFVASYGLDSSANCNLAAPCRSFNAAIAQTNPGGEVVILDTAGYGPMVINKSLKVIGPSGVYGGISVTGGASGITTGIVINAGDTDEVTLRGLDVSGVPGAAGPFPNLGIDVQNAAAVHIEKSSIGNFTQDTSACVNVAVAKTTRVYLVDSFVRECNVGVSANGTAVPTNRASVILDNTRVERGVNTGALGTTIGIHAQGYMDVSLRNSMISRESVAILFDNLAASNTSHVEVINSELTRNNTALQVANGATGASPQVSIVGSQIFGSTDVMLVSNTATGANTWIKVADSYFAYTSAGGIQFANSAADNNSRMSLELVRSQISHIVTTAIDLNATNGNQMTVDMRDSTLSNANTLVKTSGSGSALNVSIIRSNLHQSTTAIDHGQGGVQLTSSNINYNGNDFVNNGSGNIISDSRNQTYNNTNTSGFTYINPTPNPSR